MIMVVVFEHYGCPATVFVWNEKDPPRSGKTCCPKCGTRIIWTRDVSFFVDDEKDRAEKHVTYMLRLARPGAQKEKVS